MSDNNIVFNKEAKEYVPKKKKVEEEKTTNNTTDTQPTAKKLIENEKEQEEKDQKGIQFNLNAKEYVPKKESETNGYKIEGLDDEVEQEDEESEDDIIDELVNQELNDPIDPYALDEEESDDEKWFPKYKECTCCEGYIYKCNGDVCTSLGVCFCKAQEDYDPEVN